MKASTIQMLNRLIIVTAPSAAVAAICGRVLWSDESLKQEIGTISDPLGRLRSL